MEDGRVTISNGTCSIRLTGEMDFANADQLAEWLFNQVDRARCKRVDLDLQQVNLVDSSGIRTLILAHRHAAGRGVTLRVVHPQPGVRRILETTGLQELLGL